MKKKICILGSTGSIGKSTLEIISKNRNDFDVILLSGNSNFKLLISQAKKFKPKYIYSSNFYLTKKIKHFPCGGEAKEPPGPPKANVPPPGK